MVSQRVRGAFSAQGTDLSALVNAAAAAVGADPRGLLAGLISESNLDEQAARWGVWPDVSFGLGQQTVRYARVGDQTASAANIAYCRAYYEQPAHAIAEAAAQYGPYWATYSDYHEAWSRYNGGAGLAFADNPNAGNIARGWRESAAYLEPEDAVPYAPDTDPELQRQDWTCSVRTATWLAKSVGGTTPAETMETLMVQAGLVSPADGLEDGSGTGLAAFLAAQTGLVAHHGPLTWADLQARGGQQPLGMGAGPPLYHWVAVRRVLTPDTVALMNPAPGYMALGDTMSAAQFAQWGPWYGVWLDVAAEEDPAVIAELQAQVADLQAQLATEQGWGTSILDDTLRPVATALTDALASKGARGWAKVAAARQTLQTNANV